MAQTNFNEAGYYKRINNNNMEQIIPFNDSRVPPLTNESRSRTNRKSAILKQTESAKPNQRVSVTSKHVVDESAVNKFPESLMGQYNKKPTKTKSSLSSKSKSVQSAGLFRKLDSSKTVGFSTNVLRGNKYTRSRKPSIHEPQSGLVYSGATQFSRKIVKNILSGINNLNILLKCRGVCTTWRNVIDEILPAKCAAQYSWSPYVGSSEAFSLLPGNEFQSAKKIEKFMSDMSKHRGNPFPTRCVKIYASTDLSPTQASLLFRKVPLLLTKFGQHIWSFVYEAYGQQSMTNVAQIFQAMPNLRHITLAYINRPPEDIQNGIISPAFEWAAKPLPPRRFLTSLNLISYDGLVVDAILNVYGDQLTHLVISGMGIHWSTYCTPRYSHKPLPNVKKLKIYQAGGVTVEKLPTPWSLISLSLVIKSSGSWWESCATLPNLCDVIDSHHNTLVELYLHVDSNDGIIIENANINAVVRTNVTFPLLRRFGIPFSFTKRDYPQRQLVLKKLLQKFVLLEELEFLDWRRERRYKSDRAFDAPLTDLEKRRMEYTIGQYWRLVSSLSKICVYLYNSNMENEILVVVERSQRNQSRIRAS